MYILGLIVVVWGFEMFVVTGRATFIYSLKSTQVKPFVPLIIPWLFRAALNQF